ncbi:hypothetical protein BC826DRAFT_1098742 [Russula brevipes]|nr:hypothetical protein BC826DRAFT_1098742 [Russula brevipes]
MSHSHSPSPAPTGASETRHAPLLKDPAKPAPIPAPPKEKVIRPARDMMKNVQGSSAGAGSGEFHVYKASRRREYERLKAISDGADQPRQEAVSREFEERKRQREEEAEAKTAKNRAKRQKKKERAKGAKPAEGGKVAGTNEEQVLKKRRVVNGKELVFRKPGEESDEDGDKDDGSDQEPGPRPISTTVEQELASPPSVPIAETPTIMIHEDD